MAHWLQPDWHGMFVPTLPLLETFLRGTLVYLSLFVLLRVVLRRPAGGVSISDMLLIVLIADASQNAMAKEYKSVPDGLLLVATLMFWDYSLDWLSFRFSWLQSLTHPRALMLIKDGQFLWRNMRREMVTKAELWSQIREQGLEDLNEVEKAFMEGDGRISIIKKEVQQESGKKTRKTTSKGRRREVSSARETKRNGKHESGRRHQERPGM